MEELMDNLVWERIELPTPEKRLGGLPVATHQAVLEIAGCKIKCYQLSDGQRVVDVTDVNALFGADLLRLEGK